MNRIRNAVSRFTLPGLNAVSWRRAYGGVSLAGALLTAILLLALPITPTRAQQGPLEDLSTFPKAHLTIKGSAGAHEFTIWVADTPARDEQGLMFVRELPADRGMVFSEAMPRLWSMWMKNTFIPLDMLFIGVDGRITRISHALPHDETIISSGGSVKAVIELQGGISERLHLAVGDTATWKGVQ